MDKEILLDFDGVILDSMVRIEEYMKIHEHEISWKEYLINLDWYKFLRECKEINNSISLIRKMQYCSCLKAIITKINSMNEGTNKIKFLQEQGIYIPVILVPFEHKKTDYYYPNNNEILVDDSIDNIREWNEAGGLGILFDLNSSKKDTNSISNLNKVLKKSR
ncbi:MAG: hypothetical protein IJ574_02220 [Bacilli bacterium]|nr:hypothetical protein [Bacilli bacterium]